MAPAEPEWGARFKFDVGASIIGNDMFGFGGFSSYRFFSLARRTCALASAGVAALVLPAVAVASTPSTYSIEHYAGTVGVSGNPTPGPALSAVFNDSWSTAVNAAGDVYVADYSGDVVDEISTSGYLSIVAGQSQQNGVPTPGPATATKLKNPTSIAIDAAGNVFFTDFWACEVDELNTAGQLSIIAGDGTCATTTAGPASSAIGNPYGIAITPDGTIYFSDQNDDDVWKIDAGMLVRVAGTGSPGAPVPGNALSSPMNWPQQIALDAAGDLYVTDARNNVVEKITPAGILSVIAGTGSPGAPVDGPATSSPLDFPDGIAVDAAGDIFISDGNSVIDEVTPDGQLSVIAGEAGNAAYPTYGAEALDSALGYVIGISVAPDGVLYLGDDEASTVDALVPDRPTASSPPAIGGTPAVGQVLTATNGSWTNQPLSYTYQWQDCNAAGTVCTDIPAATASTYRVAAGDSGYTLRVLVTAHNASGDSESSSQLSAVIPAVPAATAGQTNTTTPAPPVTVTNPECPVELVRTGAQTGLQLGPVALGMTRSQAQHALPTYTVTHYGFDRACLAGGPGKIRVAYPSERLLETLSSQERAVVRGRVILALTANTRYTLDHVVPGTATSRIDRLLKRAERFQIGVNTWYVLPGTHTTGILKVQDGVVGEIGIADHALTATRAQARRMLASFPVTQPA